MAIKGMNEEGGLYLEGTLDVMMHSSRHTNVAVNCIITNDLHTNQHNSPISIYKHSIAN